MGRLLPFFVVLLAVAFFTKLDFFFYLLYTLSGIYILGRLWARRSLAAVAVRRQHDERVFLGQRFAVQIEIRNRGWLPVLWLRLSEGVPVDLGLSDPHRWVVSFSPHEKRDLSYTLVGRRRGYYRLGPLVAQGGDVLGSATYEHRYHGGDLVIVYPKIVPLRDLGFPSLSPAGTLPSRHRLFEDPSRVRGVREYQPGDALKRMDWKASARVGSLQVRRYEPSMSLETGIYLNLNSDDYALRQRRTATELGIVIAASVATHLIEKRQAVSLATNGHDPLQAPGSEGDSGATSVLPLRKGREHLMQMLDLLARIERTSEGEAVPFLDLLNRKSLRLPWGSTVVVITAQGFEALFGTLLALRRRGLLAILALTVPDRDFALTAQRAEQVGVPALRIWSEQDLDVWRGWSRGPAVGGCRTCCARRWSPGCWSACCRRW
jgi:uncharacterized protein (DUF58 family)